MVLSNFINNNNHAFKLYFLDRDWSDELLSSIGFSDFKPSQIGDTNVHFRLLNDPMSMLNKHHIMPRIDVETHHLTKVNPPEIFIP